MRRGLRKRRFFTGLFLLVALAAVAGSMGLPDGSLVPVHGQEIDMNRIFPPSDPPEVRDMLLQTCSTSCHSFVPLVIGQKTQEEWVGTFDRHRPQIEPFGLSEEQIQAMIKYLQGRFNPENPVPKLPPALLQGWATQ